jgi:hypothetical protein
MVQQATKVLRAQTDQRAQLGRLGQQEKDSLGQRAPRDLRVRLVQMVNLYKASLIIKVV